MIHNRKAHEYIIRIISLKLSMKKNTSIIGIMVLGFFFVVGMGTNAHADNDSAPLRQKDTEAHRIDLARRIQKIGMQRDRDLPELTEEQKDELKSVRESGDRDVIESLLEEYGIDPQMHRNMGMMVNLSDEQKETLKQLHEQGDREAIMAQLKEWGIQVPEAKMKDDRGLHLGQELTAEQLKELADIRKTGDKEAVDSKLAEWGIEKPELTDEQKARMEEMRENRPSLLRRIFKVRQESDSEQVDDGEPNRAVRMFLRSIFGRKDK